MRLAVIRVFIIGALSAAGAFGQSAAVNGQISGTVTDPSGAPVAAAHVEAVNAGTGYRQTVTTSIIGPLPVAAAAFGRVLGDRGCIRIHSVSPHRRRHYRRQRRHPRRSDATQGGLDRSPGRVGGTANRRRRTDVGSTLSSNAVDNLPLVSRNPYNFILQQPNVSGHSNTEFGVPRKVNANGFNGRINYQLDGSNNVQSDRAGIRLLPISQTWVQEVQAVSNGFAPEFGNTVGTVFNTITRSGTNAFHGEGGYLFRRTPMSARPALLSESARNARGERRQLLW